jgi:hypothetical protein
VRCPDALFAGLSASYDVPEAAMEKLEAAQTMLEKQAQGKLPGVIDKFMVSTEDAPESTPDDSDDPKREK